MEIKLDVERTRQMNEAFAAAKQRESAVRDKQLLEQEEPDERLRRLVKARGQLTQARLCYWGLPSQAVIWGYQAIDNSIHAALLADEKKPPKNHQKKVTEFCVAFAATTDASLADNLSDACNVWNPVRDDRRAVSRETGQRMVDLGSDVFDVCRRVVGERLGMSQLDLEGWLEAIADSAREPEMVHSEAAIERIEARNMSEEANLESMGLSGMAAQAANSGRDIFIDITADQSWVRDMIEDDPSIANEIAQIHQAFYKIAKTLVVNRAEEILKSEPAAIEDPTKLMSFRDFNLNCVLHYSGLSIVDTMRRLVTIARETE